MKNSRRVGLEHPLVQDLSAPWVLVLGGVSRAGDRRARRAVLAALEANTNVIWFDGFERPDDDATEDPTIEPTNGELLIVGFRDAERRLFLNRIENVFGSTPKRRKFRNQFVRPLGTVTRSYRNWILLRPTLRSMMPVVSSPTQIIWSDDFSLASAWHIARLWPDAAVAMEFVDR